VLKSSHTKDKVEAGLDEAGRGCLAGPVVAAAVILPKEYRHPFLNDSKKLSRKQRDELEKEIKREAIAYSIAEVSEKKIDEINILNASFLAMHIALEELSLIPELLLIDGNRFKPYKKVPHKCIIQGDGIYLSIAAASILAKTYRDELMLAYAKEYPNYGWHTNMGYATKEHQQAIMKHGQTPLHRKSFNLNFIQLDLFS
jgi:ribonuclease HII